jgi:hypothetical protein
VDSQVGLYPDSWAVQHWTLNLVLLTVNLDDGMMWYIAVTVHWDLESFLYNVCTALS